MQKGLQLNSNNEISVYSGELDIDFLAIQLSKLKEAFPSMPARFIKILTERIKKNGFSNDRLEDAISHVIDNFIYQLPNVANIISFDKRVKLYKHNDVCATFEEGFTFKDFCKIKVNGDLFWVKKTEKEQYNILDEY